MLLGLGLPTSGLAYLVLFGLVAGESSGVPLPGETALITAGILASQGKLSIWLVILVAAAGAIVGDNVGYWLGRKGARRLLERPGWGQQRRLELVTRGEAFFQKHGAKAVFFGRWLPFLRVTAAWLAGAHRMHWATFLAWNAAGGISWAISIGLLAYFVGQVAFTIIHTLGYVAIAVVAIAAVSLLVWWFRRRLIRSRSSPFGGNR